MSKPHQPRRRDSRGTAMAEMAGEQAAWQDRRTNRIKHQPPKPINEYASCTTLARHWRYTGAIVALQWRGASHVGRMEMNVGQRVSCKCLGVCQRRWAAKTLLNICQAPSLHFSALASHPQQPTVQQQLQ